MPLLKWCHNGTRVLPELHQKCQNCSNENGKCKALCCFCQSQTNLDCLALAWVGLFCDTITKIKEISAGYYFRSRHTYSGWYGSLLGFVIGRINLNRSASSLHTEPLAETYYIVFRTPWGKLSKWVQFSVDDWI